MDRLEAYDIINSQIETLARQVEPADLETPVTPIVSEVTGSNGVRYSLVFEIEPLPHGRFAVAGKISECNSFKFALCEERREFDLKAPGC